MPFFPATVSPFSLPRSERHHDGKAATAVEKGGRGFAPATHQQQPQLASCHSIALSCAATEALKQAVACCCTQQGSNLQMANHSQKEVAVIQLNLGARILIPKKFPVWYHWLNAIFQGPLIPQMAFTSCYDQGLNLWPLEQGAST